MPWRVFLGFLLAPIVPCLLLAAVMGEDVSNSAFFFPAVAGMVGLCLIVIWAFAVPTYLALQSKGRVSFAQSVGSGFWIAEVIALALVLVGALVQQLPPVVQHVGARTFTAPAIPPITWVDLAMGCTMFGAFGAVVGATFWMIAFGRMGHASATQAARRSRLPWVHP